MVYMDIPTKLVGWVDLIIIVIRKASNLGALQHILSTKYSIKKVDITKLY